MRIQYELSKEKNKEIEKMMQETEIRTKRDFIDNAIALFEWAIKQRRDGNIISSVNEESNEYKEIIMPSLSNVK